MALLSAGCASQRAWPSGFLTNNAELQATGHGDDVAYVRPGINWKDYQYAYVELASIRPSKPGAVNATIAQQAELADYLRKTTIQAFQDRFVMVSKPVPGAIRIRQAITEVGQANPWVNIPAAIIAYPVDYGGVTVEMEILDASTGRRLCAMMASRTGNPLQIAEHFNWLGHARRGVDRCVTCLRTTVDESASRPVLAGPVNPLTPATPGKPEVAYVP